jgi:UDP-glucose 6-dehydrogenase
MAIGMGGHSPSNILHHLKGVDFPADKQALIEQAQKNNAEGDILDIIRQMPDGQYQSMADVLKGVGKVE